MRALTVAYGRQLSVTQLPVLTGVINLGGLVIQPALGLPGILIGDLAAEHERPTGPCKRHRAGWETAPQRNSWRLVG
jgi:hypothetical protein